MTQFLLDCYWFLVALFGNFFLLYGAFMFFVPLIKGRKAPMDDSNMWNCLIAPVYTAFRPHVFGGIKFFQNDVGDNIKAVEKAVKQDLLGDECKKQD